LQGKGGDVLSFKLFIHGLESSNRGTKSVFFKARYPDMVIPNFSGNLEQRMGKLNGTLAGKSGIRLVGSSFGGLMASVFAMENESRIDRLILLAPAINLMDFADYHEKKISTPVWVFHGREDEVLPLKEVEHMAKEVFSQLSFHIMDDDHSLHKTFKTIDWHGLLGD